MNQATVPVRVSEEAYQLLKALAEERGTSIGGALSHILQERKRREILDAAATELNGRELRWGGGEDGRPSFTLVEWLEAKL